MHPVHGGTGTAGSCEPLDVGAGNHTGGTCSQMLGEDAHGDQKYQVPEIGVKGGCEPPHMGDSNQTSPLEKQGTLSSTEPDL